MITLKPSLISSYTPEFACAKSSDDTSWILAPYRNQPFDVGVDLYLFMEPDIRSWLKNSSSQRKSAFRILSQPQEAAEIRRISNQLRARFIRPIAITSFMPEIASRPSGKGDPVDTAIYNLMRFALEICQDEPAPVLQLAAGSTIDQVRFDHIKKELLAVETHVADSYSRILDRIDRCYRRLPERTYPRKSKLKIAFELEPGPLHILRNLTTLCDFLAAASCHSSEFVQKNVGLNLDMAHWYLAEEDDGGKVLTPETLSEASYRVLRDRIFHSHISGHSTLGHFGDKPLKDIPQAMQQAFKGWLKFLRGQATSFSGYVSLEYEMAPRCEPQDRIAESLQLLHQWLEEINQLP